MTTALYDFAQSIPSRTAELRTLVQNAQECEQKNEALYNALCRALSVLIASHLEGFTKGLAAAITADLNYHLGAFKHMPAALKHAFCVKIAHYDGINAKEITERVKQLIDFFESNSVPINLKAITYKETSNKSATADVIDKTMKRLGIPSIVGSICDQCFQVVFDNDSATNEKLLVDMGAAVKNLAEFPYKILSSKYKFDYSYGLKGHAVMPSLWHAYIDEIMQRRHKVAHGEILTNETTWNDLTNDIVKLDILMYALIYSTATFMIDRGQNTNAIYLNS